MGRKVIWIPLAVVGLYLVSGLVLYFMQTKLVYHPGRELAATPADVGLAYTEVNFTARDGTSLHGWHVEGKQGGKLSGVTALFCHGNAGNISHRLETLRLGHDLGLSLFIFDYRGYGQSSGAPSEKGTQLDAHAAWDWLVNEQGVRPERIVIWGRSLGGAVAAQLAVDVDPGALIVESSFTSVAAMGAAQYPIFPKFFLRRLVTHRYETISIIDDMSCPLLVAHSPDDEMIPYAMDRELYEAAPEPKAWLEMAGGHNEGWQMTGGRYVSAIQEFISEAIGEANAQSEP